MTPAPIGPAISGSGRFVRSPREPAGTSCRATPSLDDVFVRDLQNNHTSRASLSSSDAPANNNSDHAAISGGGRFVAFNSFASNLVSGDTDGKRNVFVRDRRSGTTERVSVSSSGAQGNGFVGSSNPSISADGCCVAFVSDAN